MIYALDTNIISFWTQKNLNVAGRLSHEISQGNTIVIPPSTYYEIRRGFKHKSAPGKEFAFSLICQALEIGEMNLSAWETAADIYANSRKIGKPIGDSDILIAAFCLVNACTLVTNNTKHFTGIAGLNIEDWTI